MKTLRIIFLLLSSFTSLEIAGQSLQAFVVGSAGEHYSNGFGALTWSLGEPVTETYSKSKHFLTQGFQQPTVIIVTSAWEVEPDEPVLVYPNPFVDRIILERTHGVFHAEVLDLQGRIMKSTEINFQHQSSYTLELDQLSPTMYILRLWDVKTSIFYHVKIQKL